MTYIKLPIGIHRWSEVALQNKWDKQGIIQGEGHQTIIVADQPIEFEGAWNGGIENCYILTHHKFGVVAKRDVHNNSCNGFHMNNVTVFVDSPLTVVGIYLRGTELTNFNNVYVNTSDKICTGIKLDSELRIANGVGNTCSGHYWRGAGVGCYNKMATGIHMLGGVTDFHLSGGWFSGSGTSILIQSRENYYNWGQTPRFIHMDHLAFEGDMAFVKVTGPYKPYKVKIDTNFSGVVFEC